MRIIIALLACWIVIVVYGIGHAAPNKTHIKVNKMRVVKSKTSKPQSLFHHVMMAWYRSGKEVVK